MLPRVQQLTSRRRAAVITGFVHGCFHLPLILIATTYDQHGSRWFVAPMVVATITAGGVFYAYLWDRTHSVWPAAIAHGAVNIDVRHGCRRRGGRLARTTWPTSPARAASRPSRSWRVTAVVLLARAKVWRTDKPAPATEAALEPVA